MFVNIEQFYSVYHPTGQRERLENDVSTSFQEMCPCWLIQSYV